MLLAKLEETHLTHPMLEELRPESSCMVFELMVTTLCASDMTSAWESAATLTRINALDMQLWEFNTRNGSNTQKFIP